MEKQWFQAFDGRYRSAYAAKVPLQLLDLVETSPVGLQRALYALTLQGVKYRVASNENYEQVSLNKRSAAPGREDQHRFTIPKPIYCNAAFEH